MHWRGSELRQQGKRSSPCLPQAWSFLCGWVPVPSAPTRMHARTCSDCAAAETLAAAPARAALALGTHSPPCLSSAALSSEAFSCSRVRGVAGPGLMWTNVGQMHSALSTFTATGTWLGPIKKAGSRGLRECCGRTPIDLAVAVWLPRAGSLPNAPAWGKRGLAYKS